MQEELIYVGFRLNRNGRLPNMLKINEITELDYSRTKRQTQVLIGKINPFRKYIADYAKLMRPLYKMIAGCRKQVHL